MSIIYLFGNQKKKFETETETALNFWNRDGDSMETETETDLIYTLRLNSTQIASVDHPLCCQIITTLCDFIG